MKEPWTQEELEQLIPKLEAQMRSVEEEHENIKPVPPLTEQECIDYLCRLVEIGTQRILTDSEVFLHGQLLAQFRQSVIASTLHKRGRYYVIHEDEIKAQMQ